MAEFVARELDVSRINGGQKFTMDDSPTPEAWNDIIENSLFLKEYVLRATEVNSFRDIRRLMELPNGMDILRSVLSVGDQISTTWKDTAAGQSYEVPFDVVHFGEVTLEDGRKKIGMYLQWHYATPFGVQFDAIESGFEYGRGFWSVSAARQFLNSDRGIGEWWIPQHDGDVAPSQLTTKAGFLTGFDTDFLSCIKPVLVSTAVSDYGKMDNTYDKFFLPSTSQVYAVSQVSGEGEAFDYWKNAVQKSEPNGWYDENANPAYITYAIENPTMAVVSRLRSVSLTHTGITLYQSAIGAIVPGASANTSTRFAPVCVVC